MAKRQHSYAASTNTVYASMGETSYIVQSTIEILSPSMIPNFKSIQLKFKDFKT